MLQLPMVVMLHKIENTANSRLETSGMTAGKLVPVENFYKDLEATKWIKSYVLQSIIKEVLCAREINTALHNPICTTL